MLKGKMHADALRSDVSAKLWTLIGSSGFGALGGLGLRGLGSRIWVFIRTMF